jgi:hypothetical protein
MYRCIQIGGIMAVALVWASGAKPPDLPVNAKVICRPEPSAAQPAEIDAEATATAIYEQEEQEARQVNISYLIVDTVSPCFCEAFYTWWQRHTLGLSQNGCEGPMTSYRIVCDQSPAPPPGSLFDLLGPSLLPIDPNNVQALQELLSETGDPDMPKLIIRAEELAPAEEAEEEEAAGWLQAPPDPDFPPLFVVPDDLKPLPEEAADEDDDSADPEPRAEWIDPDWGSLLVEVLEAVEKKKCVEIDGDSLALLRFLGETQLGAVHLRLFADADYRWQCVVVALIPEESGDLRAAQRAHNDRIIRWIEAMNETADEADDGDLDCEPVDPDQDGLP